MIDEKRLAELRFLHDKWANEGIDFETLAKSHSEILNYLEAALRVVRAAKDVMSYATYAPITLTNRLREALAPFNEQEKK